MPVIPVTQEDQKFEASPGKSGGDPFLKTKGQGTLLKW
jgi:hypothetical protein